MTEIELQSLEPYHMSDTSSGYLIPIGISLSQSNSLQSLSDASKTQLQQFFIQDFIIPYKGLVIFDAII